MLVASTIHHCHHTVHAVGLARHVVVAGSGILEREPYKFATALNVRPVEQLIAHGITPTASTFPGARASLAPRNEFKGVLEFFVRFRRRWLA